MLGNGGKGDWGALGDFSFNAAILGNMLRAWTLEEEASHLCGICCLQVSGRPLPGRRVGQVGPVGARLRLTACGTRSSVMHQKVRGVLQSWGSTSPMSSPVKFGSSKLSSRVLRSPCILNYAVAVIMAGDASGTLVLAVLKWVSIAALQLQP